MNSRYPFHGAFNFSFYQKKFCNVTKLNISYIASRLGREKSAHNQLSCPGHCVKSVKIRSFVWSVFSCIQSVYRKIRTRKNCVFGHFSHSGKIAIWRILTTCMHKSSEEPIFSKIVNLLLKNKFYGRFLPENILIFVGAILLNETIGQSMNTFGRWLWRFYQSPERNMLCWDIISSNQEYNFKDFQMFPCTKDTGKIFILSS